MDEVLGAVKRTIELFCKNCGSLVFPKNGKYHCEKCDKDMKGDSKKTVKMKSTGEDVAVLGEEDATLPKTKIICPECKYTEAYYTLRQTRSADEPETRIYRCCKCNYSWREY